MAVDEETRRFICGQLARMLPVRDRRMFGGLGLYEGDLIFGIVANDTLYLKADQQTKATFEQAGMHPFEPFPDKRMQMSYYGVPADILEDLAELRPWVDLALEAARRAPAKKRKAKKPNNSME